jgi:biotin operon repressor
MSHISPFLQKVLATIQANPDWTIDDLAVRFGQNYNAMNSNLVRLRKAGCRYRLRRKNRLAKTDRHESVVKILEAQPGACAKTIAKQLGISPTTVNRTVLELRNMGFIIINGYAIAGRKSNDNSSGQAAH